MKKVVYSTTDRNIVEVLKGAEQGMTVAELSAALGTPVNSGNINGAKNKGLISQIGTREVLRPSKRKVATYRFVTDEVALRSDNKPYAYSDNEKKIMEILKNADAPMTLNEIAAAMGVDKLSSGSINALANVKGNIEKADQVEVSVYTKSKVAVWGFLADIPTDAE